MRIMVTNDDGIDSPGIHALAIALTARNHEVTVIAPRDDMSGVGAAIGKISSDQQIETKKASIPDAPEIAAYSLVGPPGLAVMASCLGAFGDVPDLVVTGINAGPNTGHACLHSGTVGAALTAATFGISALATSMPTSDPMHWGTACELLGEPLDMLGRLPAGSVINLNAPNVPYDQVRGVKWARLDRFGRVRLALADKSDGWLQMEYRTMSDDLDPDSDTALLEQGYATLTAIEGISEVSHAELLSNTPAPRPEAVVTEVPETSAPS